MSYYYTEPINQEWRSATWHKLHISQKTEMVRMKNKVCYPRSRIIVIILEKIPKNGISDIGKDIVL